jgi:sugar lactone lactonase YvrE
MRSSALRYLLLLTLPLGLPAGMGAPAAHASPQSGIWQVLGAARTLPTLYQPAGLAVDARGNVYVADSGNFRIVEIGPRGQLLAHFGEADLRPGPGAPALPNGQEATGPRSLAVDAHGTVYVADSINHFIRVFSPQHHLVGDWPINVSGATVLQLAVAIGGRGNVIVAIDARVRCTARLGPSYCATYYVVQRRSAAGAVLSQFHSPIGPSGQPASPPVISQIDVAVGNRGEIYVATSGMEACYRDCPSFHFVIKHGSGGKVLGHWGTTELDVSANWPALALGGGGNVFLADDYNHRIDKRTAGGTVVARWSIGSVFPTSPICSETPYAAGCRGPVGVAVDRSGSVYVSDPGSGRILKLSQAGRVLAQWGAGGSIPGRFWSPGSVAVDPKGRLWVDDATNSRVQILGTDGRFHVQFAVPHAGSAMALDRQGNVYIGQSVGQAVYISKFSSSGKLLARLGPLHTGMLSYLIPEFPSGIAVAPSGDIFVAGDFFFPTTVPNPSALDGEDILRLDPGGRQLGVFHINFESTGSGIAVDAQENSYIAYGTTPHFEKWSRDGVLLASWGVPKPVYDAPSPAGIALDSAGNIYVANTPQSVIEEFGPDGRLLSTWGLHGSYPGQFHHPGGIAVDPTGMIYVADTDNHRVQKLPR